MTKLAIIYYSATGHGTTMAHRVEAAATAAGAEVRVYAAGTRRLISSSSAGMKS